MSSPDTKDFGLSEDQPVRSQELISKKSTSGNLPEIKTSSFKPLETQGGAITTLTKDATSSIASAVPEISEAGLQIVKDFVERSSRGHMSALPMICKGEKCHYIGICPLKEAGTKLPVGERCPVESTLIQLWVNKHLVALDIKDISDPSNSFDLDILYEIAANELIRWRLSAHLSQKPALIEERAIAVTPRGKQIFAEVISPAIEALDVHGRLIGKLREALIATRRAQIQAGREMGDPSRKASEQSAKARELIRERMHSMREDIKEADFTVQEDI